MKNLRAVFFEGNNMPTSIGRSDERKIIFCIFPEKYRTTETFVINGVKYINTEYH